MDRGALLAGRYVVEHLVAEGGTGLVYAARDLKLARPVAVKVLADHSLLDESRRRFAREARIGARVSHVNVCAVTDAGASDDGTPFLVMELLRGETLASRMSKVTRHGVAQAVDLVHQIASGLEPAHALGFVHRDLKPENVFVVPVGIRHDLVKILDFGVAYAGADDADEDRITRTGVVVGTARYMAPEQLRGFRDFDARTDVFACGLILYELLAGGHPFGNLSGRALRDAMAFSAMPPLASAAPHVPAPLSAIVMQAVANDRSARFPDVTAFRLALETVSPTRAEPVVTGRSLDDVFSEATTREVPPDSVPEIIPDPEGDWNYGTVPLGERVPRRGK